MSTALGTGIHPSAAMGRREAWRLQPGNPPRSLRAFASMAAVGPLVFVFGGRAAATALVPTDEVLCIYSADKNRWLQPQGIRNPETRSSHRSAPLGLASSFTPFCPGSYPAPHLALRSDTLGLPCRAVAVGNKMYVFGGGNAKDKVNLPRDLLCLTVDTAAEPGAGLQWSTTPTSAGIGPAGKSAACCVCLALVAGIALVATFPPAHTGSAGHDDACGGHALLLTMLLITGQ